MKKITKRGKKTGSGPNQNQLAKALGISKQLMSLHLKNPEAPKALDDIDGWTKFLAVHGREGSAPPDLRRAISQKRLELISQQVAKAERENKEAFKHLERSEDVAKCQKLAVTTFSAEVQRMVRDLPSVLVGLTEVEIRQKLQEFESGILPTVKEAFLNYEKTKRTT